MDRFKLEGAIKSTGWTIAGFCDELGMSRSAFYRKVRGQTDFTQSEILAIIDLLKLENPMEIFFSDKVS